MEKPLTTSTDALKPEKAHSGREIYFLTLSEIEMIKLSDVSGVPSDIQEDKKEKYYETYDMIRNPKAYEYPIPRPGINAEVLFYLALKDKVNITPSTFTEDCSEYFDFNVLGTKIDITSSTTDETFKQKWQAENCATLLIPERPLNTWFEPYTYTLLYRNTFDSEMFLKDVLSVNYELLKILKELKRKGSFNKFGLREDQFGRITAELITKQQTLLNCLSNNLDIPPDKT